MITTREQVTASNIMSLLLAHKRQGPVYERHGLDCRQCQAPHRYKIVNAIQNRQPLLMVLPAFPAKSANRLKTLSAAPDMAEVVGLRNLNSLCQKINAMHAPGVKLLICSDGRVFNDLVFVSDAEVDIYQKGIMHIIQRDRLSHLDTFSLDDVYPDSSTDMMQRQLMADYGDSLEHIQRRLQQEDAFHWQFNGIHRFMTEDLIYLQPQQSKNQSRKQAKEITYEVIRRSNAWSALLASRFPQGVRLSIHPQACGSDKLGIQFLAAANRWATPWHNVLLKNEQGWQLIKRAEAERLGAHLRQDHYVLEAC